MVYLGGMMVIAFLLVAFVWGLFEGAIAAGSIVW